MTTPSGPITLTPAQFAKTPAAAKPGATYQSYQRFVNNRRAANPPTPPDPYSSIIAGLPKPLTGGQVQSEAQGEISPIVAAIVAAITKQDQGATSAITGYSNDAASKLAAINYGAPYSQGEGAQAAVDASLAQSLAGQGSSDAQGLQARLAAINDPSVAAAAANVSQNATGAANADTAQGSAALSNLIANAAAANSYGQQQPGIQRAAGLQDIAGVQQTGQANIASGTQAAEQQLPSILQSLTAENDNRSSAIASAQQNQLARNDNIAAGTAANLEKTQTTNANNNVKVQIANANNATKTQIASMNQQGKVSAEQLTQARSDRTYRLQFTKTYGYDPVTGKVAPGFKVENGSIAKVGTSSAATANSPAAQYPDLSKTQVDRLRAAMNGARFGIPAAPAVGTKAATPAVPAASYQEAIAHAVAGGISRKSATIMANHFYAPGVGGRPQKGKPFVFNPAPPIAGFNG